MPPYIETADSQHTTDISYTLQKVTINLKGTNKRNEAGCKVSGVKVGRQEVEEHKMLNITTHGNNKCF